MRLLLLILCVSNLWPRPAMAALGGTTASIEQDRQTLRAEVIIPNAVVNKASRFSVFTMRVGRNTLKEFLNSEGIVFAIAWRGDLHPDFKTLLGQHYSDYVIREAQTPRGRRYGLPAIQTAQIIIRRGGHIGDFHGLAVLSDKVPAGVSEEELF